MLKSIKDKVKIIVFDFDGVMTDNRVLVDENGKESVFVSRADGMGIDIIKKYGIECVILSTETSPVVQKRADKLKIDVIQGVENKALELEKIVRQRDIGLEDVLYIGNDLNDLEVMKIAGMAAVPSDAYDIVKKEADIVLKARGGYGVARELASLIGGD